ncbi:UvrD-helicase domain-containing protein, partial [uncultured Selenomonas sp.]|uniref:UvrD-helicase domain-containing protein n=1 Tax=uncultured Selenomonas sp. TaxID=159275 RepID=UPI002589CCF2
MANDMRFTADQRQAIDTRGQNILVAAAAGSGKTRVLVERIIARVRSGELSLDRVLVLTFTKAAAAEMRERIETALNVEIDRIAADHAAASDADEEIAALERQRILLTGADISTFHSFCQRILQTYIEATQIPPNYRLASEQEILLLTNDVFEQLLEEKYTAAAAQGDAEGFLAFADAYVGDKGGDERLQKAVLALYKFALSQPSPETWLAAQGSEPDDTPYWERAGFSLLVDELLGKICADYRRALALLSEGDDAFRAAAEKTRDAVLKHLGIYEALAGEVEAFAHAQNTAAWTKFVSAAAAAKK